MPPATSCTIRSRCGGRGRSVATRRPAKHSHLRDKVITEIWILRPDIFSCAAPMLRSSWVGCVNPVIRCCVSDTLVSSSLYRRGVREKEYCVYRRIVCVWRRQRDSRGNGGPAVAIHH